MYITKISVTYTRKISVTSIKPIARFRLNLPRYMMGNILYAFRFLHNVSSFIPSIISILIVNILHKKSVHCQCPSSDSKDSLYNLFICNYMSRFSFLWMSAHKEQLIGSHFMFYRLGWYPSYNIFIFYIIYNCCLLNPQLLYFLSLSYSLKSNFVQANMYHL